MRTEPKRAAKAAGQQAQQSKAMRILARSGLAVSGVLHLVLGLIVIRMGSGGGEEDASQSGALAEIAAQPFGEALLAFAAIGLAALAIWQIVTAITATETKERLKSAGKAVVHIVLAALAGRYALGLGSGDTDEESLTATLMAQPWGAVGVAVVGAAIAIVGVVHVVIGVRASFVRHLRPSRSRAMTRAVRVVGRLGYIAKGIALGVLGGLFVTAALSADAEEAGGLDEAFATIGDQPFGSVLLILTGAGFACYGLYSLARSRYTSM